MRLTRRGLLGASATALGLSVVPFALRDAAAAAGPASNVHVFYYPWYGTYRHWDQGGHTPPTDIGANYYPVRGAYNSGDPAVLEQHMTWIAQAGAGVVVTSWWGQGSYEDTLVPGILDAAARHGLKVAWHLEPYPGRTAASTVADINYLIARYGPHAAFYRDAQHGNRGAYYVFESLRIADWSALAQVRATSIVLAQTTDTSKVANFGGMYTYDGIAAATAPGWADANAYCRANGLVWAPSVAPGYIDDRAVPGNTTPTLGRDNGAAYDRAWNNALTQGGLPTWVSITSFNEWHEGSSIEPASSTPPAGQGYLTYSGAYGLTGAAAETAYLTRTRYWVDRFVPTPPAGIGLRSRANGRFVSAATGTLVASATAWGTAERFEQVPLGGGAVALRAAANGMFVCAENAGAAALVANRAAAGAWESFQLLDNGDGSFSLRADVNGRYVCAENAGAAPLIANRTAVGQWEKFDLVTP
ncbi:hypothetical protein Daura_25885 [Dactylosporangium aurantiacum]|uniref:Alpha-mannosidase n=1 Tax=Dactylosporangium aurantiacum TaxID=35754 RepID=A0A9Q9I710_9ACTN|nr:hypothetical protein [Dactylosporangium aurantiacum]MDG6109666.1 hypothetical protein [Dactylosporangium aurantiacum]UWZ50281.1 hypothetical protein Daura_25885 [Dactylosporangium aurantiacum]